MATNFMHAASHVNKLFIYSKKNTNFRTKADFYAIAATVIIDDDL